MPEKQIPPSLLTVFQNESANLCARIEGRGEWEKVSARRAFPYTDPDHYVALYSGDEEIGVIRSLDELDADSRTVLADALRKRYHIPVILRIIRIDEVQNATRLYVETDSGPRSFEVQSRSNFRRLPDGGLMIIDVDSNRYRIPDRTALDKGSREQLDMHF